MKSTPKFKELETLADEYLRVLSSGDATLAEQVTTPNIAVMKLTTIVHALQNNAGDPAAQVERIAEVLAEYLPEGWDEAS